MGMLSSQLRDRWTAAEALSKAETYAESLGADLGRSQGSSSLPDCWFGTDKKPDVVRPVPDKKPDVTPPVPDVPDDESDNGEGDIVFLTFISPTTNIKVNMLAKLWDKDGVITLPDSASKRQYVHSGLRNGDVIE